MGSLGVDPFEIGIPLSIYLHYKFINSQTQNSFSHTHISSNSHSRNIFFFIIQIKSYTFGNNKI